MMIFDPVGDRLEAAEEQSFANDLVEEAVSSQETVGWPCIDEYIERSGIAANAAVLLVDILRRLKVTWGS
ncbi:MAG: hypothetical protein QM286_09025 [Acidobacteriota bacterium]|nr:hypothetical protein [Acidobacteriota bacterium]